MNGHCYSGNIHIFKNTLVDKWLTKRIFFFKIICDFTAFWKSFLFFKS